MAIAPRAEWEQGPRVRFSVGDFGCLAADAFFHFLDTRLRCLLRHPALATRLQTWTTAHLRMAQAKVSLVQIKDGACQAIAFLWIRTANYLPRSWTIGDVLWFWRKGGPV